MAKAKIKIAVVVDTDGEWNSYGWGGKDGLIESEQEMLRLATDPMSEHSKCYWIETEIDIPEIENIKDIHISPATITPDG